MVTVINRNNKFSTVLFTKVQCFCEAGTAYFKTGYVNLELQRFVIEENIFELILFKHSSLILFPANYVTITD
jgi:hypothetical protein